MNKDITYVALDAHKKEHQVAMLLPGEDDAETWTVANTAQEIRRMIKRIQKRAPGAVAVCYEAGPCGFSLQRIIQREGVSCAVVAPSLIPVKPGERIKTDRRDARKLASMFRAGLLTEVSPPTEEEEALRDLCRLREAAQEDLGRVRHRVGKFLLRRGIVYGRGSAWTGKHLDWLRSLRMENDVSQRVLTEYLVQLEEQMARVKSLDNALMEMAEQECYREQVAWLRCFRGIDTLTAITLVAELYGIERFQSAPELMAYLGLVPSEHSSGERRNGGGITKTGNRRVRRLLIEASWHQRRKPLTGYPLRKRREGQPEWVVAIARRAQKRLHQRYWSLVNKGKLPKVALTAVAREFVGFIWSVLHLHAELVTENAEDTMAA